MKRLLIMLAAVGLAACGTTGAAPPTTGAEVTTTTGAGTTERSTTTTEDEPTTSTTAPERDPDDVDDDLRLVVEVWEGYTSSWETSTDAGLAFLEANVYPDLGLTAAGCRTAFNLGPTDTFKEVIDLDEDTIEPAYDWEMPQGPERGEVPDGWVYVMTTTSQQFLNGEPSDPVSAEVHVTVVDGRAYFFYTCGPTV
jgi:hypothetical protein